ncbi:MAG: DUF1778 domain-containing protein [Planctomycetes bacterium]|nr:DUF1778 domain-containing protein [Planctomycetota bacterium]
METANERDEDDDLPPLPHAQPLSDADRDLFLAVLDNPPAPNAALRKLMAPRPSSQLEDSP